MTIKHFQNIVWLKSCDHGTNVLTHGGLAMYKCISKLGHHKCISKLGHHNGLLFIRCETIIWTSEGLLLSVPLEQISVKFEVKQVNFHKEN